MTNLDRSPYRFGGWSPTALPLLWLWFPVMFSGSRWHDGWAAAIQLAVVLVGLGITFYVVLRPNFGSGTFAAMRRLHRRLPWFEAMPVTAHAEVGRADFAATLANHGFGIIDLDGSRIGSWSDLARELENEFGARRFPSDPRRKVAELLGKAWATERPRRVLRWRDAAATARANPALLAEFASSVNGFLPPVFLDLPSGDEAFAPDATRDAQVASNSLPRRRPRTYAAFDDESDTAPAGATAADGAATATWWQPEPGELTRDVSSARP